METVHIVMGVLACALLFALAAYFIWKTNANAETEVGVGISGNARGGGDYTNTTDNLRPSKFSMFGRQHYYQIPANPKGTFVFFPGCVRKPFGFWPYHAQYAPECTAFPEDISHTKQALRNGYAILVPMARSKTFCMNMTYGDHEQVGPIIRQFLSQNGLANKPLYLGGSSSGGGLAVRLPGIFASMNQKLRFDGIVLEAATNNSPLRDGKPSVPDLPPIVWVCFERDTSSQKEARAYSDTLKKFNKPSEVIISPIRQVHPEFFSDRMTTVTPDQSRKIVGALKDSGVLDDKGIFKVNPADTMAKWIPHVKKVVPNTKEFAMGSVGNSPLLQAMNVAHAQHEHVADYMTVALKYFESGGKASMTDLLATHTITIPAALTV